MQESIWPPEHFVPRTKLTCIKCKCVFNEWLCCGCRVRDDPQSTIHIIDAECPFCHDERKHERPDEAPPSRTNSNKYRVPRQVSKALKIYG